jgi:hypothetical protein
VPLTGDPNDWVDEPDLFINDVIAVLYGVEGVRHVATVTLNGAAADLVLPGPGALTRPGTITPTITT